MKISPIFALLVAVAIAGLAFAAEPLTPAARQQLETQALAGNADAALELALDADEFGQTPIARATAARWYQLAADRQVAVAHLRLGKLAEVGDGVPQDFAVARAHYEQAAAAGLPAADLQLGILYLEGWGVPVDRIRAVAQVERAASAGYQPAQLILSQMYASGIGPGLDLAKALHWAKAAAAKGDAEGQLFAGLYTQKAANLMQDARLAREWYQLSAEQDYDRAMIGMATTYLRPGATAADVDLFKQWLTLAVEGGSKDAPYLLAMFYAAQSAQDPAAATSARQLLQLAADRHLSMAVELLDIVGRGRSVHEAFAYAIGTPYTTRYIERYFGRHSSAAPNRPPQPLKVVRAIYPPSLRMSGVEGKALVEFTIDTTGRVRDAKVVSASHPAFGESALASIVDWRFDPGRKDGHRVNTTRVQLPVQFDISVSASPIDTAAATP